MKNLVTEKKDNAVVWLTINRPDAMNALDLGTLAELTAAFKELARDDAVRAIVLTGAGDRAFCAGGDIKAGAKGEADNPYQIRAGDDHPLVELFKVVSQVSVPVIARINGHALGGGFGLACMADMAICSRNAKLGSPEAKIGLFPMIILAHMLRLVPQRKLYEMAITGRSWSADEAYENGILNAVVDAVDDLDAALNDLLKPILQNSPTAIRVGKRALAAMESMNFEQRLSHAQVVIDSLSKTEDAKEGLAAFAEKRKPLWPGK
ncbi:MAG: enoyl-CoA hydratase [Halieaceae bacterium]|jgi:enoyl-CoA hydratase/carnithine racemase|nr:enoyl-CoA hydratase [Halieaceae bacterium]